MLDRIIGPVTNVLDGATFQMNVTHIGTHNKFRYNNIESISIASNNTGYTLNQLRAYGVKVSCYIKHRDIYNRLYADVYIE